MPSSEPIEVYAARIRGVCLDCDVDLDVCTCGWDDDTYQPADSGVDFGTHYSMCPVSDDNDPVEPRAVYVRVSLESVPWPGGTVLHGE